MQWDLFQQKVWFFDINYRIKKYLANPRSLHFKSSFKSESNNALLCQSIADYGLSSEMII